jgi:hypothetical protein
MGSTHKILKISEKIELQIFFNSNNVHDMSKIENKHHQAHNQRSNDKVLISMEI